MYKIMLCNYIKKYSNFNPGKFVGSEPLGYRQHQPVINVLS